MSNPFIAHLIDLGELNPRIGRHPIGGDLPQKNTFEEDVECVLSFTFEKRMLNEAVEVALSVCQLLTECPHV